MNPEERIHGREFVLHGLDPSPTTMRSCANIALRNPGSAVQGIDALTSREREVFVLLARGSSPKQAAGDLGISVETAYVHRANVLAKLGLRNDRDLYRLALDSGLLVEE